VNGTSNPRWLYFLREISFWLAVPKIITRSVLWRKIYTPRLIAPRHHPSPWSKCPWLCQFPTPPGANDSHSGYTGSGCYHNARDDCSNICFINKRAPTGTARAQLIWYGIWHFVHISTASRQKGVEPSPAVYAVSQNQFKRQWRRNTRASLPIN